MFHMAVRITASIAQQAFRMKKELSESLLKIVMQYGDFVDNKYTRYGKDMEPKPRVFFITTKTKTITRILKWKKQVFTSMQNIHI